MLGSIMNIHNLVLIGFGNVNRALVKFLESKKSELKQKFKLEYRITGVMTRNLGWLADASGLDTDALLRGKSVSCSISSDIHSWLEDTQANLLFEASSLEPFTGQPATDYMKAALEHGCHVVTANKGPIVHAAKELYALAESRGIKFRHEASFMGGSPIYSLFRETLPAANIRRFRGLLNSTTSTILQTIEAGSSFIDGIKRTQEIGIAETDPSLDVDGWDSAVKVCGLANVLLETQLDVSKLERVSIRDLEVAEIREAAEAGTPIRQVAFIDVLENRLQAGVRHERIALNDPLRATGTTNISHFELDVLPGLTITTHNAGATETAYDMLADFINVYRIRR
jgi:homoserine dehydrogenase